MKPVLYSETLKFRVPGGLLARVREAAEREERTLSEYLREAVRRELEDAR